MTIFQDKIKEFGIKVVDAHSPVRDPQKFIEYTRGLMGIEGFVIAWDTGHRVKCKAEDYLRKHHAKDSLSLEKNVISMIVDEKVDDVKAFLDTADLVRVQNFEQDFWQGVTDMALELRTMRHFAELDGLDIDKATYAVKFVQKQPEQYRPFLYKMLEKKNNPEIMQLLAKAIAQQCGSQTKVDSVRWIFNAWWHETNLDA